MSSHLLDEKLGVAECGVATVIECLPSCVGPDNPPRYAPELYRDLVLAFYNANYFHRPGYAGAGSARDSVSATAAPRAEPSGAA